MPLLTLLMTLPLVSGLIVLFVPQAKLRAIIVRAAVAGLGLATLLLAVISFRAEPQYFALADGLAGLLNTGFLLAGIAISLYLLYACRRITKREAYIPVLILVQLGLILFAELGAAHPQVAQPFYVDSFAVLMALIIGLVGGLIILHAVRYMADYHAHDTQVRDRRPAFFFMLLLFLGAMFGIVFSNQLTWLFLFWEITTLCSFWLIGYDGTEAATRNAFHALGLNLVGGVAFAGAIVWLSVGPGPHTLALDQILASGGTLALLPAALIGIAGLTKSAQLPFSSWLLGAMVAPTSVSALLHSSTMVNAGVFVLIKFAPVYHDTLVGVLISLIGGITFLVTSLVAINQSNAKRVLAYSTIANLGLIVMCAGVGTATTLWAAMLLLLFHAVAKGLLFLGTGTTEHLIGSRNIEDMEGLVYRRPVIAVVMLVGILGMFLAPFGMLLSKYACFQAFLSMEVLPGDGVLLAAILAFGSAPTLFFWSKWMGKLVAMPRRAQPIELPLPRDEAIALLTLTGITFLACVLFPLADWSFVQPYTGYLMANGLIPPEIARIPAENLIIMSLMLAGLFLMPLAFWLWPPRVVAVSGYLSGANITGSASYRGAMGAEREVASRGYYLKGFIQEETLFRAGLIGTGLLLITMLGVLL